VPGRKYPQLNILRRLRSLDLAINLTVLGVIVQQTGGCMRRQSR